MNKKFNVDELSDECWKCENCDYSIDLSWVVDSLIEECSMNEKFKDNLLTETESFAFTECDCCNHSYWLYDVDLIKIQEFIRECDVEN